MINVKEVIVLLVSALVLGYVGLLWTFLHPVPAFTFYGWMISSLIALAMLAINSIGYKLAARFFDSHAEIQLWTTSRYGFNSSRTFSQPFPIWAFLPIGLIWITFGAITWLAITTFETSPLILRERKAFSRVSEWDTALIGIGGLLVTLIAAFLARFWGFNTFSNMSLWFILFNLIPLGNLVGNKIFFGSKFLWIFSVVFFLSVLVLFTLTSIIGTILISLILAAGGVALFYYLVDA